MAASKTTNINQSNTNNQNFNITSGGHAKEIADHAAKAIEKANIKSHRDALRQMSSLVQSS